MFRRGKAILMSKKVGYGKSISAKSNAKINLFLYITGKRDDGYHNIYSYFAPINLYDTITITPNVKTILSCNKKFIPLTEKNIILKVDKILRDDYGLTTHFKIDLIKRIPIGAGLGGGSSNAATYLNLVTKAVGLNISMKEKENIMAQVGSDTIFFLHNKPAIVTGRGENIEIKDCLPKCYLLLIYPNIFIATKNIYSNNNLRYTDENKLPVIKSKLSYDDLTAIMSNDLENPVFSMYDEIKILVDNINENGNGKGLMSGSGATVYGLYKNIDLLNIDFEYFTNKYPRYFIKKAEIINL